VQTLQPITSEWAGLGEIISQQVPRIKRKEKESLFDVRLGGRSFISFEIHPTIWGLKDYHS
jgi:hypothetical protein